MSKFKVTALKIKFDYAVVSVWGNLESLESLLQERKNQKDVVNINILTGNQYRLGISQMRSISHIHACTFRSRSSLFSQSGRQKSVFLWSSLFSVYW